MKVCVRCNHECKDDAPFCVKCGKPFDAEEPSVTEEVLAVETAVQPEEVPASAEEAPQAKSEEIPQEEPHTAAAENIPQEAVYQAPPQYAPSEKPEGEVPMSFGKCLLYGLILMVPFVSIIMLCVWGFGHSENTTFRNWSKAQLFIQVAAAVLSFIVGVIVALVLITGASTISYYSSFINL